MRLSVISVGNSRGVRIPKAILERYGIKDAVEIDLTADGIVLKPIKQPREGWEGAFQQMHDNGDDQLLIPDVFDDETLEEW